MTMPDSLVSLEPLPHYTRSLEGLFADRCSFARDFLPSVVYATMTRRSEDGKAALEGS